MTGADHHLLSYYCPVRSIKCCPLPSALLLPLTKMKSTIRALAEFILQNIDTIEGALDKRGASVPSLDDPFTPGSDIANGQPELMATTEMTVRAAFQLIQTIRLPQYTVIHEALSVRCSSHSNGSNLQRACLQHTTSASMRCVTDLNIAEILREAGPDVGDALFACPPIPLLTTVTGLTYKRNCKEM